VFKQFIEWIQQLGAEYVILSSDLGQSGNPSHTEGLLEFVAKALTAGITQSDLGTMLKTNPAILLGLP
jgi:hypothetical protein